MRLNWPLGGQRKETVAVVLGLVRLHWTAAYFTAAAASQASMSWQTRTMVP
jgi:hypothetical protein